jgi:OOP family OmpA-OmpF porin
MKSLVLALAALGALASCGRSPSAPQPSPTSSATPAPTASPVSIIRDDVDVDRQPPPLAPLLLTIGFPEGGAKLDQHAVEALQDALKSPQMAGAGAITLRGHTDSAGGDAANLQASRKRAEAVRDWLVSNGVDEDRIAVIALGEQNPAKPNALPDGKPDEAGRAANRRVEMTIAVPEGTPAAQATGDPQTLVDQMAQ